MVVWKKDYLFSNKAGNKSVLSFYTNRIRQDYCPTTVLKGTVVRIYVTNVSKSHSIFVLMQIEKRKSPLFEK